jgi:hypothetical protein
MMRYTTCAVARMDAEAEAAMADFNAVLRGGTLPAKERRALRKQSEEACFQWNALRHAMAVCPTQSKRGLLAQIRLLGDAAMCGDTDRATRLVAVIREGVESLVPDDG